jgi:hypothetical protein
MSIKETFKTIFSRKNRKYFPKINFQIFPIIGKKSRKAKNLDEKELSEKIILFLLLILLGIFYSIIEKIFKKIIFFLKTDGKNEFLICPIRGKIGTKIYDEAGNFTEEYHRINLIKSFLKKGFEKKYLNLNHKIQIGHKGRNSIIPDLVITKKNGDFFIIVEVKKNSNEIEKALNYQLNPAIRILNSEYGIYYDGTEKSIFFKNNKEPAKDFNFLDLPD